MGYSLSSNIFQLQLTFSLALSLSIALFCTSSLALSLHTHSRFGGGKLFGLGSTFEFFIDGGLSRTFPDRCALIVSFELLRTGQRCRIVRFDLIRLSKATALSTDWMQRIYIAKIQHTHTPASPFALYIGAKKTSVCVCLWVCSRVCWCAASRVCVFGKWAQWKIIKQNAKINTNIRASIRAPVLRVPRYSHATHHKILQ